MRISIEEQLKIITKGAHEIISIDVLKDKLIRAEKENKFLTLKLGLDPSAPDIHLGHSVVLRKIRQMQDLGHHADIVIGDFTGKIGDPTGKSKARNALTTEEVLENAVTYQKQIFKILDSTKTTVRFNSEWLSKMNFEEVLRLTSTTTVARMLERDDFKNRFQSSTPIGIHEFLYPLMQAQDSVTLRSDIELGGTDQTFNILMGRTLQKSTGQEPQVALFMPILVGLDGIEKMSKSLSNYIGIDEDANIMFKNVMELPDFLIIPYFELTTDEHPNTIKKLTEQLKQGENPRNIKFILANTITGLYHTHQETIEAAQYYNNVYTNKNLPIEMPELTIPLDKDTLIEIFPLLVKLGFSTSNSELRRLISQGGIQINQEKIDEPSTVLINGDILQIGKKKFVKINK